MHVLEPLSEEAPAPARSWRDSLGWRDLEPASPDLVVRLAPMLSALRWATLCLALALSLIAHLGTRAAVGGAVLVAYTLVRTIRPIGAERRRWRTIAALLLEVAVGVGVVEATGFDHSPFLVCLGVSTVIAGFAGGLRVMSGLAAIAGLAVALPSLFLASNGVVANASVQFSVELVLVGVVGGFSRYLVEDAQQAREGLSDRVEHLAEVNELLLDLHRATEREVTPMHVEGAVRWALERLEEMFEPDAAAVVLLDPATDAWHVAAGTGVRTGTPERPFELLPALRLAAEGTEPVTLDDLERGLTYRSRWGLYCPMRARGEVVGVLAVESATARGSDARDRRRLSDLARAAALAIDNGRWLERIHTLGMEQERTRLARELHDHIGQSVVYIGFELDRLVQLNHGRSVQADLMALRSDLRDLVEEMRDMLVDLRTDVSETQGVDSVLESFLERVNKRNRVEVSLVAEADSRMPLAVEREVWRVAREAVMNAERHAHASHVSILWLCNADGALLEVADDGVGIPAGKVAGTSGYGLVGMRERADSIGAQLEITSGPGTGTLVRMRVRAA